MYYLAFSPFDHNQPSFMPHNHFQQPISNEVIALQPLKHEDFETLFEVASDPLIWQQHPNPNRYQRPVFETFFEGALASEGAYLIIDKTSGEVAGSSRFYDYNEDLKCVFIGYTFIGRKFWGKGFNPTMKQLMLNHAFRLVNKVYFHVGENNRRSQIAMERLGAEYLRKVEVAYHGEPSRINIEYLIKKEGWNPPLRF